MRSTAVALFLVGCAGEEPAPVEPGGGGGTAPPPPTTTVPGTPAADLVEVGKVSVYQGVETVVWTPSGPPSGATAPVIAERDAFVRVFLRPTDAFAGDEATVELSVVSGGAEEGVGEVTQALRGASTNEDLASTWNFDVTGLPLDAELRVSVRVPDATDAVVADTADLPGGMRVEASDDLRIVIVPIQYDADGSGRLPDTSEAALQELHDAMFGMYPARSVTMAVADVVAYDQPISAINPLQWQQLLDVVSTLRGAADEPANTYYFGMFVPDDSFDDYCVEGCIAGLSAPGFNTTNPSLRTSVGLGYEEVRAQTVAHEIGHAHGRLHAPCGGALGTDPRFPYDGGLIGSWGYDVTTGELYDPAVAADVMGYCEPLWVSDYTYEALWERISLLATQEQDPSARTAPAVPVTKLRTDGLGHTTIVGQAEVGDPTAGGIVVDVDVTGPGGAVVARVPGWYFPYDHVPGGVVTLDHVLPPGFGAVVTEPTEVAR